MVSADLKGKVALITGAGSGIGKTIALALARNGSHVALAGRTLSRLEDSARECAGFGVKTLAVKTDVSSENDVENLFRKILKTCGRLDVCVNNAGAGRSIPLSETSGDDWDWMMDTNAKGTFLCSREALKAMVSLKIPGFIINVASQAGKKGYPHQSAYCASKFAVRGFSKALAMEAKEHSVKVHVLCPGGVNTGFIGKMRPDIEPATLIQPEDIAEIVLFLLAGRKNIVIDEIAIRRFASEIT